MLKSPDLPEPPGAYLTPSSGGRREFVGPGYLTSALPVIGPSLRTQCLLRLSSCRRLPATRRKRKMVPPEKKDAAYMSKRLKNNEAAKRSREKRRMKELLLEGQLLALSNENARLRDQVLRLRYLGMSAKKSRPASGRDVCPAYSPVASKPPIGGEEERNPSITPSFRWAPRFHPLPQSGGLFPGSAAGPADAEAHQQGASVPAFLPRPDAFHPAPMFPYRPAAWLVPGPAADRHFPLPWVSPLLASAGPHPSLPVWMHAADSGPEHRPGGRPSCSFQEPLLKPHFTS